MRVGAVVSEQVGVRVHGLGKLGTGRIRMQDHTFAMLAPSWTPTRSDSTPG